MKPETLDTEILGLVKGYCKPKAVSKILSDIRRVEAFERKMTAGTRKNGFGLKNNHVSLADREKLDQLITLCQANMNGHEGVQLILDIGDLFRDRGEMNRAEELYTIAMTQGELSQQRGAVGEAYMRRGDIYCRLGRWRESTADLDQSRKIYYELNEHVGVGRVDNIMGTNCAVQGKLKQAQSYFQRALTSFERSKTTVMTGTVLMNMGIVYNIMGQYDVALINYRRARSHFEEVGDLKRLAELHHNMGMSYLFKQQYNNAIREFDTCRRASSKIQNANLIGLADLGKANAYYQMNDLRMALMLVNQALEYFAASNDRLSIADGYKVKGMIHREMKKLNFAESFLKTSLRINLELKNELNTGETYFEIGLLEKKRNRFEEAQSALQNARLCFKKIGASLEVRRTEEVLESLKKNKNSV